ncbi:hypothetical protein Pmani_035983 [Petrolisthes manimaculis]|uniref:Uncharacterized protein n=1 Tax=Petrolisthes manimaculis TaxID=1843537 RepID=A0AAE1TN56_9EUCA|nr:hypothetical protein Pmani_035983 [Petrolisthes manimaculis]
MMMGRRKPMLWLKRQQRGSTTLVFLILLNCLHFTVSSPTTNIYQRIIVDLSDTVFASCPSTLNPLGVVKFHNPMFICNGVCDKDPACIFASVEGDFCKLFTVRLMLGIPSGTVGTAVYRNTLDLIEPGQNLVSYVQAVTSTTDFTGHPVYDTSLIGNNGDTTDTLFIFDDESYGPLPYKKFDVNLVGRYITLTNIGTYNICLCKMMIYGTP